MKTLLNCIIAVATIPIPAQADYHPASFADMAATSEAIVVGTISKLERDTYTLQVEQSLVGPVMTGEITVQRFRDWPCAARWSAYEVDQKLLVFANYYAEEDVWIVRGAASEGESPVVENQIHAHFYVPGKAVEYDGPRGKQSLNVVGYDQLRAAVQDFRESYRFTPAKDPWRRDGEYSVYFPFEHIEPVSQPTGLFPPRRPPKKFQDRSSLHRFLAVWVDEERARMEEYDTENAAAQ